LRFLIKSRITYIYKSRPVILPEGKRNWYNIRKRIRMWNKIEVQFCCLFFTAVTPFLNSNFKSGFFRCVVVCFWT
jgi:hypothetical protein